MKDDADTLRHILARDRTIAVVGLSDDPQRPSFDVARAMQRRGWQIVPVNPRLSETLGEVLGEPCFARLEDIPFPVHMVNVFRREADMPEVARSAVAIGARSFWQQLGLRSAEADRIATEAGLDSVWNRCLKVEAARLMPAGRAPTG